jgi:hypothetical protein
MRTFNGLVLTALLLAGGSLAAQTAESPARYRWVATPCDTWGCSIAALAQGNGDPYVIVLPTKSSEHPWVVLKRVEAGIVEEPEGDPVFVAETYSTMLEASSRFSAIDIARLPILVTTTDGGMLVVGLHEAQIGKKRSVRK